MYPVLSLCFFLFEMRVNLLECNFPGYTLPLISYWNCFTLYMQQASVLLFDMLYNLAWLGPCFSGLVLAILIFSSLPDIYTTLTFSCPFVSTWHCSVDSAGVLDSTECGVFFLFFFFSQQNEFVVTPFWRATKMAKQLSTETTHLYWRSIGVMFMSCRINFYA